MIDDTAVESPSAEHVADPGLPLDTIDRGLSPIRRVVAYAVDLPDSPRFLETNLGRWLEPLLHLPLPEALREPLLVLAGQLSGIDTLEAEPRRHRLEGMRQAVRQLDRLLGLPLPEAQTRRPRPRRPRSKREETAPEIRKNRTPKAPRARQSESSRAPGRRFWSGNPYVSLDTLELPPEFLHSLDAAGLVTVGDVIRSAPVDEELIRPIHGAGREIAPGRIAVGGRLKSRWTVLEPSGGRRAEAVLHGAGPMRLRWSDARQAEFWLAGLRTKDRVVVVGNWDGHVLSEAEFVADDGKVVRIPRYGIDGVDDARLHALVFRLLPYLDQLRDPVDPGSRSGHIDLPTALRALHGQGDAELARQRLAYDEVLTDSIRSGWERWSQRQRGIQHSVLHSSLDRLLTCGQSRLDDAQQRAFEDIKRDLRRSRPMRRVLFGAPGGGKALIALLAAVAVAESKCQVLWLTPDGPTAEFAHTFCEPLLRAAGLVARRVTQGMGGALRDAVRRGDVHVVFGPASLLASGVEFRRLGLVVLMERTDLGILSESVEQLKSPRPDVLVVPAIAPTSGELSKVWPGYDLTALEGRRAPDVVVRPVSRRDAAYAPARQAILSADRVLVLFPQIQGRDALDPTEAQRVVAALGQDALAGARIALMHGAMPPEERIRVVQDLAQRRVDALVCTIPMEDGPPIPRHTITVVEHADRMTEQRLRRLGGLAATQVSLVVREDFTDEAQEDLIATVRGEALRKPTHGELANFRFFDSAIDLDILVAARRAAFDLLSEDGGLRGGHHAELVRSMRATWDALFGAHPCPLPEVSDSTERKRRRRRRRKRRG